MTPRKHRRAYKRKAREIADRLGISIDLEDWEQVWSLLDKEKEAPKPMYVYALCDYPRRAVKFGKSRQPKLRAYSLKTGNPGELRLWAYCVEQGEHTEKKIHKRLVKDRISGEWFRLTDSVQQVITEMRQLAGFNAQ